MIAASLSNSIDDVWLRLPAIRVGSVPASAGTPDRYVTVTRSGQPALRIDVYSYGPDCFAFEEVVAWRDMIIVGFGSHVHVVSVTDSSAIAIELGSYFGHLYPEADFVLLASAERLFRLEPDRSIRWKSDDLGIDGVLVHEVGPVYIRGEGEWDPPGGWRAFSVLVVDGAHARVDYAMKKEPNQALQPTAPSGRG